MDDEKLLQIADDQLNFLDRMSALHRQRMLDSIQALERRIVDRASALKTSESGNLLGAKTNLAQAQKVHSDMTALFDEEYGAASRETVKEYGESLPVIQEQYQEMGEAVKYTGVDRDMVKALKTQDLAAYASYGLAAQDKIAKAVYNHVIAQAPFSALVGEIAAALTGQKDKRGRPLANYAKQMANDGIMNFHNTVNLKKAEDAGFTNYLYVGNIIADSRPFCIARAGNVYTREQIDSWTGTWQGKSGPAFTHRGGYNCRHHWQPVRKEWIPEGGIEVQSWFDRAGVMPVSKLPKAVTGAPKFKAWQAWQQSVLIGKKPLDAAAVAKAAGVPKSAASGWLSQWQRGYNLPQGWQSVVRDLEAKAGGFERTISETKKASSRFDSIVREYVDNLNNDLKITVKPALQVFGDKLDEKFFEVDRAVHWGGMSVPIYAHETGHGVMSLAGLSSKYNLTKSAEVFYSAYKDRILTMIKSRVSAKDFSKIEKEFKKKNIGRGFGNSVESYSKLSREFWKDVFSEPMVETDILVGDRKLFSHYSLSDANEFWADAVTARLYGVPTGVEDLVDEAIKLAGGVPPKSSFAHK